MNLNEFKLRQLTQEIQFYETEDNSVKEYNRLKELREQILNDLSHTW